MHHLLFTSCRWSTHTGCTDLSVVVLHPPAHHCHTHTWELRALPRDSLPTLPGAHILSLPLPAWADLHTVHASSDQVPHTHLSLYLLKFFCPSLHMGTILGHMGGYMPHTCPHVSLCLGGGPHCLCHLISLPWWRTPSYITLS